MKLGQVGSKHRILEPRQDLVAHVLVLGHAALQRRALGHHAAAKDRVGRRGLKRGHHVRQLLRRILPVAVQQHHHVHAVVDGHAVTRLLVAAIAQVSGLAHHGDREVIAGLAVAQPNQVGVVGTEIITDVHLLDAGPEPLRDAIEHLAKGGCRVVGDNQDADAQVVAHRQDRSANVVSAWARSVGKSTSMHRAEEMSTAWNLRRSRVIESSMPRSK